MRNDNEQLSDILQHEYTKKTGYYTHSDVPEDVTFEIDGYKLKVKYPASIVEKPIVSENAFEGWMMVCRRWGVFDKIIFDWEIPENVHSKEYQVFLSRVKLFSQIFKDWFEISKDGIKHLTGLITDMKLDDKLILESIIDICWFFETGKKISIKIPENWIIYFDKGVVQIKAEEKDYGIQNALDEDNNQVYTPWQLLINRWAYLPTSPRSTQQSLAVWDTMSPNIKELIKVGFTERNFPYPAEY